MADVHALVGTFRDQGMEAAVALRVPTAYRSIVAAAAEHVRIGAEGYPPYALCMALKRLKTTAGARIPDANRLIIADTGQLASVGTEGDAPGAVGMTL